MKEWQSLAHVRRECKYHVVFVPKYRKKVMYGRTRKQIGKILRHPSCAGRRMWKLSKGMLLRPPLV